MTFKRKAPLIVFEGVDGCGKGTQIELLEEWMRGEGIEHAVSREPGGTSLGEALRRILKEPDSAYAALDFFSFRGTDFGRIDVSEKRCPESEVYLFLASRAEYVDKVVMPALEKGVTFVSDRMHLSTLAYQGGGRFNFDESMWNLIERNNDAILGKIGGEPDAVFVLDVPYEVMVERLGGDGKRNGKDYIESSGREFFERVIRAYRIIGEDYVLIDGTLGKEEIFKKYVIPEVKRALESPGERREGNNYMFI